MSNGGLCLSHPMGCLNLRFSSSSSLLSSVVHPESKAKVGVQLLKPVWPADGMEYQYGSAVLL